MENIIGTDPGNSESSSSRRKKYRSREGGEIYEEGTEGCQYRRINNVDKKKEGLV